MTETALTPMPRTHFGTDGVRGVVGETLTTDLVERLGRAAQGAQGAAVLEALALCVTAGRQTEIAWRFPALPESAAISEPTAFGGSSARI